MVVCQFLMKHTDIVVRNFFSNQSNGNAVFVDTFIDNKCVGVFDFIADKTGGIVFKNIFLDHDVGNVYARNHRNNQYGVNDLLYSLLLVLSQKR